MTKTGAIALIIILLPITTAVFLMALSPIIENLIGFFANKLPVLIKELQLLDADYSEYMQEKRENEMMRILEEKMKRR